MGIGFDVESASSGGIRKNDTVRAHIFTHNSPVVVNWGLCSFTLSDLDFLSYNERFQFLINGGSSGKSQKLKVMTSIIDTNEDEYINISVWRDKGRNGEYVNYAKLSDWEFKDSKGLIGAEGIIYRSNQLVLEDFLEEAPEEEVNVPDPEKPEPPEEPIEGATQEELEEYEKALEEYEEELDQYHVAVEDASVQRKGQQRLLDLKKTRAELSKGLAVKLINLNDYINSLDFADWDNWSLTDKIRFEFLTDIRSSRERCVNWESTIQYYTPSEEVLDKPPVKKEEDSSGFIFGKKNRGGEVIDKNDPPSTGAGDDTTDTDTDADTEANPEEAIETRIVYKNTTETTGTIKLYLYSTLDGELENSRSVCLKNMKFASSRSLYDVGSFLRREDGKLFNHHFNANPDNLVAGPLDLQYNEYLGKWESGSPQMIAVISETVSPAQRPSISSFEKDPIEKLLDPDAGQEVVYGYAIPLHMQNANPRQWSPVYSKLEVARGDTDFEKSKVKVHNLSENTFNRGEIVILNRIEGLWFPIMSLKKGGDEIKTLEPADPQWEFIYLATNADFHFKTTEWSGVTPNTYEKGFYNQYYKDFADISSSEAGPNDNKNKDRYSDDFNQYSNVNNEYYQLTSFDFLASLGGNNNRDVIEETIYGIDLDNNTYGEGEVEKTAPFWGCVFPEGYSANELVDRLKAAENKDEGFYGIPKLLGMGTTTLKNPVRIDNDLFNSVNAGIGLFKNYADGDIKHLPADIATNASKNGTWGRPIDYIGHFDVRNNSRKIGIYNENSFNNINKFLSNQSNSDGTDCYPIRGSYHYLQNDGENTPSSGYKTSFFNLQPLNPFKIQFRPLSRELYMSMAQEKLFVSSLDEPLGFWTPVDRLQASYSSDFRPSRNRNLLHLQNPQETKQNPSALLSKYVWQGNDSYEYGGLKLSHLLRYEEEFASDGRRTNLLDVEGNDDGYPSFWWDYEWWGENNASPAGGMGIVGAVTTVRSQGTISLSTDNLIGVGDYLVVNNPIEYASTMKNGDYSSQLTTALYARVYQHHPRHLTWYDPRLMVVHHFNAGDGRVKESLGTSYAFKTVEYKFEQEDKSLINEDNIEKFYTLENSLLNYYCTHDSGVVYLDTNPDLKDDSRSKDYDPDASGWFNVEKIEYPVDFRVPTLWDETNADIGKKVFEDSTTNLGAGASNTVDSNVLYPLRKKEHWNVNRTRRSKLLPYSYKYKTIGIGKDDPIAKITDVSNGELDVTNFAGAIVSSGTGYKEGDKFEVLGSQAGFGTIFTVTSATQINDQGGGEIQEIAIQNIDERGMNYNPDDFVSYFKEVTDDEGNVSKQKNTIPWNENTSPSSKLSLSPLDGVTGTGFECYIFFGKTVLTPLLTDPKPLEALDTQGPIKVTPDVPRNDINRLQGQITTARANSYQITKAHFDNKYDIFLRYHNDISHVAINESDPRPLPSEQQVTLSIGVNLGQTASTNGSADQLAGMLADELSGGANNSLQFILDNMNDGFNTSDGDQAADQAGSFLSFGGGVGGNSSFR